MLWMCDDKCCDPSKNPRTVTNDARAAAAQLQKFAKINYGVWSGVQQTLTTRAANGPSVFTIMERALTVAFSWLKANKIWTLTKRSEGLGGLVSIVSYSQLI